MNFPKASHSPHETYNLEAGCVRYVRGFYFSDGLEEEIGFVWDGSHLLQEVHPDGRYTYLYTDQDSYEPLAQIRNWTNEDGESKQEIHYFHCDQIGIPR
ncbi:VgrG protein [Streptococcus infantis]|uniref:VgrG protein n=1 Tax=Streptococcus infantis TaxID=68892 RepID=A0A139RF38_9STRE|nr:hypothetical protein [Streptococcus infantis]KXU13366.1 VgrG protein [Streptococcus infantis]